MNKYFLAGLLVCGWLGGMGCAAQAAPASEPKPRQFGIVQGLDKKQAFEVHQNSPAEAIVAEKGKWPVVDHQGKKAVKIQTTGKGSLNFSVHRGWTKLYLGTFLPDGFVELTVCGEKGGEDFKVGFNLKEKNDAPNVAGMVKVSDFGKITREWKTIKVPLAAIVAQAKGKPFNLENAVLLNITDTGAPSAMTVYLAEAKFTTTSPETQYLPIKVNQLGYRPGMEKIAKISAPVKEFKVVEADSGKTVFTGQAKLQVENDEASGDTVYEADFTALKKPGKYRLKAAGREDSDVFEIREDIYDRLTVDLFRFYYLQRCNMELEKKFAGEQAHPACHLGDKTAKTQDGKDIRDVTGGWHDAGDNNKYPTLLDYSAIMLMAAYDLRPQAFTDGQFNIPESGNGIPDVLDEVVYELDWLPKMQITQGPDAGAVYEKIHQSGALPEDGKGTHLQEPRRLFPPNVHATTVSAATLATAVRTLAGIPEFKERRERYLASAKLSWDYLVRTGAPGKDLLFPAIGLYLATGENQYAKVIARELDANYGPDQRPDSIAHKMQYDRVAPSIWMLTLLDKDEEGIRTKARRITLSAAQFLSDRAQRDGYGSSLWNMGYYCWSSTAAIGRLGMVCWYANQFAPDAKFQRTAESAFHYTLGRNAVATSFVTQYGTRSAVIFHHIYGDGGNKLPTPAGYVPGGVNSINNRGISAFPAKHYRPDAGNWTINEPALYYNAPMTFLAAQLAELKTQPSR